LSPASKHQARTAVAQQAAVQVAGQARGLRAAQAAQAGGQRRGVVAHAHERVQRELAAAKPFQGVGRRRRGRQRGRAPGPGRRRLRRCHQRLGRRMRSIAQRPCRVLQSPLI